MCPIGVLFPSHFIQHKHTCADVYTEDRSRKLSVVVPVTSMERSELCFSYLVVVYPPNCYFRCSTLRVYTTNSNSIHLRTAGWNDTLTCICKKTLAHTCIHSVTCTCYIASLIEYMYKYMHINTQSGWHGCHGCHGPHGDQ